MSNHQEQLTALHQELKLITDGIKAASTLITGEPTIGDLMRMEGARIAAKATTEILTKLMAEGTRIIDERAQLRIAELEKVRSAANALNQ